MKKKLVVLTGAGISAESGIKTFRDSDGLWEGHNVMDVATPEGWYKNKTLVLDFYNQRRKQLKEVQPNLGHQILAELENDFDVYIITQNVDDLHERAGSSKITHLHGELLKVRSSKNENYILDWHDDLNLGDNDDQGHQLRPHIVWFDEQVTLIPTAKKIMRQADVFILVGSSLQVYPAAGLINYVPLDAPKYIIDKKIPPVVSQPNMFLIEKPATEGVQELCNILIG